MKRTTVDIPEFRTLNTAKAKANLLPGECSTLVNAYPFNGKLRIRPNLYFEGNTNAAAATNGAQSSTGLQQILVSGTLHQVSLNRSTLSIGTTLLTDLMSLAIASSGNLWRSCHLNGKGYAVRSGLTKVIGFDATNFWSVGIAAPTTAAVLATGAAAVIEAGTYIGVFTFVDADGNESDYSPVSNAHDPATLPLNWSSVDVSTNPRVTARKLYRTLPDQTGEYFYVGTIANNTATTYTGDAITVPEMGDLAPTGNTPPPAVNYVDITTAFERIWVTDGEKVYASKAENPDSFDPEYVYQFSPDDGQKIKAIRRVGSRIIVFKQGSIWALEQSLGAFEFLPRLVDSRNGVTDPQAIAIAEGQAYFFNGKALCVTDGVNPAVDISTSFVREFSEVDSTVNFNVAGGYYGQLGWVIFSIPNGTAGARRTFVYNTKQRSWFEMSWNLEAINSLTSGSWGFFQYPRLMESVVDSAGAWGMIALGGSSSTPTNTHGFYGVLIAAQYTPASFSGSYSGVLHSDGSGGSGAITATTTVIPQTIRWSTQFGAPSRFHLCHRLFLCTDNPTELGTDTSRTLLATVSLYLDEESSASRTRTSVVIVGTRKWKTINLSALNEKATLTEIEITRSSLHELVIEAARIEGDVWDEFPQELA